MYSMVEFLILHIGFNDSFDENKTKVMGGLIKKFCEAKENNLPEVVCWRHWSK